MVDHNKDNLKFFAETARFRTDDAVEEEEAKRYLELWKKFLLRRFDSDIVTVKFVDEQWTIRDPMYDGPLCLWQTMCLKICLEADWRYELRQ